MMARGGLVALGVLGLVGPLRAQALHPAALSTPSADAHLMCKELAGNPADSAVTAYAFAVLDDSMPRVLAAGFGAAGQPRTIEVSAEVADANGSTVLQQVVAKFLPPDSLVVVRAAFVDGARIARNPAAPLELQPLTLGAGFQDKLRTLTRWIWERRCHTW